ncbi:MAG: dephospho-CoA kinase [Ginsengibacter sp.]
MLRIGLTGGLGSGKSTVAHIFEVLGIPVYYADAASKSLMNDDEKVKADVINAFGKEVYSDGKLDRKNLSEIVFKDEKKLELLNSIVHPATLLDAAEWMKKQTAHYAIKEAALIFESGSNKTLDFVIGVEAPLPLRLQRAMKRDNISREQAMARIEKQMDEEKKIDLCDFVIVNDEQQMVIPQVLELHQKFLKI